MSKSTSTTSVTFPSLVFLLFLGLKLAGVPPVANWSWWWVTSPLWISWLIIIVLIGVIALPITNKAKKETRCS